MSKRKLRKVLGIIKKTRVNKELGLFVVNLTKRIFWKFCKNSCVDMPYPTTLMLELTNRCNLHCVTCPREYGYGKNMDMGNMSVQLALKVLDEALPYLQSLGLTGMGETLFAPHLIEVAQYVKKRKPSVVIFISTNANIPDFIDKVTPVLDYIDTIQVSTDGVGETYENIRHGASFDILRDNIVALVPLAKKARVDVMFNMVITKINYTSMPEIIRFASEMGVEYVNFTYFNLASVTDLTTSYYDFFHTKEYKDVLDLTRREVLRNKDVEVTGLDFPGNPGIRKCPLMWNQFQINHNGEVPPCCAKPFPKEYSFGNVSGRTLKDVLNSEDAKRFRNHWVEGNPHPFCHKCHFVEL